MTIDEKLDIILKMVKQLEQNQTPEVMTVSDCASYLHRSEATIRAWVQARSIPFFKKNGTIFFLRSDLLTWIKRGRIRTSSEVYSELIFSD
jgi:excisionase family DNA binding protein